MLRGTDQKVCHAEHLMTPMADCGAFRAVTRADGVSKWTSRSPFSSALSGASGNGGYPGLL